jgi:hypothetical protein
MLFSRAIMKSANLNKDHFNDTISETYISVFDEFCPDLFIWQKVNRWFLIPTAFMHRK